MNTCKGTLQSTFRRHHRMWVFVIVPAFHWKCV